MNSVLGPISHKLRESHPVVAIDTMPTADELKAAVMEGAIRKTYKQPQNWLVHRWANKFGRGALDGFSDQGRRVLDAVAKSNTTLRNYKVRLLAQTIRRMKPRTVLELGAGASTFLIAELLHQNFLNYGIAGKLISLEGSSDYFERIRAEMPRELEPFVHLKESEVSLRWFGGYRALTYEALPAMEHCDLIFIDGPAPIVPGYQQPIFPLSGDLVLLARAGTSFSLALTDVRWMNAKFYRDILPAGHDVVIDVPWRTIRISQSAA